MPDRGVGEGRRRLTLLTASARSVALILLLGVIPVAAHAQPARFTGDTGLLSYTVEAHRAEQFETVLQRILSAYVAAPTTDALIPSFDVRMLRGRSTPEWVVFVLWFERIVPGTDYSVEALISRVFPPEQAGAVTRDFAAVTKGAGRVVLDLDLVRRITPDDALRSRLERELGPLDAAGRGDTSADDRSRLEALQRPGVAVDQLTFDIAQRAGDTWLQWTAVVRNTSPVETLRGHVVVEFHDASGARVAASPASALTLDALESRVMSGQIRASTVDAGRVTRAAAVYTAQ